MRSSHSLDRLDVAFDGTQLVADAGLLLPATLAQHLGLRGLVEEHLHLGTAAGRANVGDKLLTLIFSALTGGDTIDDANALRAGGTATGPGLRVKAASTLGTFLRSFRWGHVRQLDPVSRELLRRAWAAGAGPGSAPFTIDLDSTICETYGLKKEGPSTTGTAGCAAITRSSRSPRARATCSWRACARAGPTRPAGPATSCARRSAGSAMRGASGPLTMRADSGFYAHAVVAVCRTMDVRF